MINNNELSEVKNQKRILVKKYLSPLLQALDIGIDSAEYCVGASVSKDQHLIPCTGGEYVAITFRDGKFDSVVYKNVTGDSLIALCRDVLKGL